MKWSQVIFIDSGLVRRFLRGALWTNNIAPRENRSEKSHFRQMKVILWTVEKWKILTNIILILFTILKILLNKFIRDCLNKNGMKWTWRYWILLNTEIFRFVIPQVGLQPTKIQRTVNSPIMLITCSRKVNIWRTIRTRTAR